jgi:DNA polymerase
MAIAVDFETFYSKKLKYSVRTMIPEQYCSHQLFDPYMVSVCDGESAWSGPLSQLNWDALNGEVWLSHNRRFDNTVFNEAQKRCRIPSNVKPSAWHCTADMTAYLCNRRALDQAVEFLYKVKVDKSVRSDACEKRWPADFTAAEQAHMLKYAKHDAQWCHKLYTDFGDKWPAFERRLADLTTRQGMHGVKINRDLLDEYINTTHEMLRKTEKQLPWLAEAEDDDSEDWEGFNVKPTATKCIAEQCRRCGIIAPPLKKNDAEAYEEWEKTFGPRYEWVFAVGAWRSINKLNKDFLKVKARLRSDDTLPFALKYFGAHTGRWSGDSGINMQNMRKVPALMNERGLLEVNEKRITDAVFQNEDEDKWPAWVNKVIDFRALVIPRAGKKMIVSDLSQIEPRVLAWITGDKQFLEYVRAGNSPYEAHARASMGYTGGKMDKNSTLYKLAKARILGLGYQCAWEKFITMAYTLARLDITTDDPEFIEEENPLTGVMEKRSGYGENSRKAVADFRSQNPKTVQLWAAMDAAFKSSENDKVNDYEVELPSGRTMTYRNVRSSVTIVRDPRTGKPRQKWIVTADVGGRKGRVPFYGGKLVENLIQATARDVFGFHLLRLEDNNWTNLFSVHDEAVLEVDKDVTAKDVAHTMSECPEWLKGCPLAADAKEVAHYLK